MSCEMITTIPNAISTTVSFISTETTCPAHNYPFSFLAPAHSSAKLWKAILCNDDERFA